MALQIGASFEIMLSYRYTQALFQPLVMTISLAKLTHACPKTTVSLTKSEAEKADSFSYRNCRAESKVQSKSKT